MGARIDTASLCLRATAGRIRVSAADLRRVRHGEAIEVSAGGPARVVFTAGGLAVASAVVERRGDALVARIVAVGDGCAALEPDSWRFEETGK